MPGWRWSPSCGRTSRPPTPTSPAVTRSSTWRTARRFRFEHGGRRRTGVGAGRRGPARVDAGRTAPGRSNELDRGISLVGPHRDDLELLLGGGPAKGYASHGESWSFALALRLGAFALLRSDGVDPVLVLDDVFAELDVTRRDRLAELIADADQVLITAAVPADVPAELGGVRLLVGPDGVIAGRVIPLRLHVLQGEYRTGQADIHCRTFSRAGGLGL